MDAVACVLTRPARERNERRGPPGMSEFAKGKPVIFDEGTPSLLLRFAPVPWALYGMGGWRAGARTARPPRTPRPKL